MFGISIYVIVKHNASNTDTYDNIEVSIEVWAYLHIFHLDLDTFNLTEHAEELRKSDERLPLLFQKVHQMFPPAHDVLLPGGKNVYHSQPQRIKWSLILSSQTNRITNFWIKDTNPEPGWLLFYVTLWLIHIFSLNKERKHALQEVIIFLYNLSIIFKFVVNGFPSFIFQESYVYLAGRERLAEGPIVYHCSKIIILRWELEAYFCLMWSRAW